VTSGRGSDESHLVWDDKSLIAHVSRAEKQGDQAEKSQKTQLAGREWLGPVPMAVSVRWNPKGTLQGPREAAATQGRQNSRRDSGGKEEGLGRTRNGGNF
jgi:hypothetical protein